MTITKLPARNEFTANAAQTIFNYTFKIFTNTDLNVYVTPAGKLANDSTDLTTDYTVTGVGNEDGGTIILNVGTGVNDLVTIVSNIPSNRTVDYQNNGDFRPETVNNDFDRVVSITKKVEDVVTRALVISGQSQQGPNKTLPAAVATRLIRWKGDLSGFENIDISQLSPPLIANDNVTFTFSTLSGAIASTDTTLIKDQASFVVKERNTGKGGGAEWDIVLLSTVTVSAGAPAVGAVVEWGSNTGAASDLAFVLRVKGSANVAEFGGQGSVSSDSAGIQSAAVYAKDNRVALVFPDGDYLIGTTIDLTSPGFDVEAFRNIEVIAGREAYFSGVLITTNLFDISGQRRFTWTGGRFLFGNKMFFQDDTSSPAPTASTFFYKVIFAPIGSGDIGRCYQADTSIGVYWLNCVFGTDLASNAIDVAVQLTGASSNQTNINIFNSCLFKGITTGAILLDTSSFNRATIEFSNCWFEDINGYVFKAGNFCRSVVFRNCYFEATGVTGGASIVLDGGARAALDGGFIVGLKSGSDSFVSCDSGSEFTIYGETDFVTDGTKSFLKLINPAGINKLHGIAIFGTAIQTYEQLLFGGAASNRQFVEYSMPRLTSTLTDDKRQDTHSMNTSHNGFIQHQTSDVNISAQNTDFVMATINVPNSSHPGRISVEIYQTIQGVGSSGRFTEWLTRWDGATWVFTIQLDTKTDFGWEINLSNVSENSFTVLLRRIFGGVINSPSQVGISIVQASSFRLGNEITITG